MNNIGKRIRDLRKKNDLTQEKLAGYLNVSYQAVSKWENGVNTPDLNLIVPLAKILHTTTDELLGHTQSPEDNDALREELEQAWKTERYGIQRGAQMVAAAEALTNAFPEDFVYREWLGYGITLLAMEKIGTEEHEQWKELLEKALVQFEMVIEDGEGYWREEALEHAINILCNLQRREKAVVYADLLPVGSIRRERADRQCRTEDERIGIIQEQRQHTMHKFISELLEMARYPLLWPAEMVIDIIHKMIPDGNYLGYHNDLCNAYFSCAEIHYREGRYEEAMEALRHEWEHSKACDVFHAADEDRNYTAPLMDRITAKAWRGTYIRHSRVKGFIRNTFESHMFESLRGRDDFCLLEQECREYLAAHPVPEMKDDN